MQHSGEQHTKIPLTRSTENLRMPDQEEDKRGPTLAGDLPQKLEIGNANDLWDYEEILEILGFGKVQWILLLVSGLLTMTSMSAVLSVGIIGIASQCEFDITQRERGIMMASCVTGVVISTYFWGCMSDVWGRRTVLLWSMFVSNFLQLVIMFVTNIWLYNIINLALGISLGGILGAMYPYLSEFNTARYRAIVINYSTMFVSVTVMFVPAISWLVLSYNWSFEISDSFTFKPWRLIILLSMLPGFIGALVLLPFPESPKLLLAHDKQEEALNALYWISKYNTGKSLEVMLKTSKIYLKTEELADADLLTMGSGFSVITKIWKATVPLFHKPHGTNVTLAVLAFLGIMFCSSGMQVWFPEIVNRSVGGSVWGNSSTLCEILDESYRRDRLNVTDEASDISLVCDDTISPKTYINNMIMGLAFLVGFSIQGMLLRPLGRKNVLIGGILIGALCGILFNIITNTTGILVLLCLCILLPGLGVSVMCGVIVDLVPTHFRGKAVSLGFTLGRIGTIVATNLFAAMLQPYCAGIFSIITCVLFVCAGINTARKVMQFSDDQQSRSASSREGLQQAVVVGGSGDKVVEGGSGDLQQKLEAGAVSNVWDYEEILNILGFGKTQWILLLISGLLTMTSMAAQLSVGIIAISSQCEFDMSQSEKGVMMAACVTGIVLSTYIWGYISDVWGRHTVLIWSTFVTVVLQFITMFVTNIWLFNFINLIMGISLGGISGVLYPYLSEFNTVKYRAVVINYSTMFVSITAIYVPAISWLVLSSDWSFGITETFVFKPWRLIILFSLLPGLIGGLLLLSFPESPKLLLAHEKEREALKALNWISQYNKGSDLVSVLKSSSISLKTEELADADLLTMGRGCSIITNIWKSTVPLFYKPHGLNVTLAVLALFGMMFASNGMQIWFPEIVNRSAGGLQSGESATVCEILNESYGRERLNGTSLEGMTSEICDDTISTKTYIDNIIMGVAFLVGFSIQGTLLNPLGRKNVLIAALAVGAFCGILLHVVTSTTGVLVLFCLYILLPGLSISIMCGAMVDLVPTHLRGKAVSLGLTLGRLGVIVASNLIAGMLEPYCNGLFGIVTCTILVCGCLVYFLPI
ncbi:Synaptic vesicle glycoprotein 2A [Lucilia cuprina]|nr:Synaptic vesicle glycoprotein 2A [Lucilia cuprina]